MGFDQITIGDIIGYALTFIFGFATGGATVKYVTSKSYQKKITQKNIQSFGDVIGGNKYER